LDMVQKHGLDWGSNYDPLDKFCGPYDCYKILNFDREVDQDGDTITKKVSLHLNPLTTINYPPTLHITHITHFTIFVASLCGIPPSFKEVAPGP